jgi:hypothetical protein
MRAVALDGHIERVEFLVAHRDATRPQTHFGNIKNHRENPGEN